MIWVEIISDLETYYAVDTHNIDMASRPYLDQQIRHIVWTDLKGLCHEIEMGYKRYNWIEQIKRGNPEGFLRPPIASWI